MVSYERLASVGMPIAFSKDPLVHASEKERISLSGHMLIGFSAAAQLLAQLIVFGRPIGEDLSSMKHLLKEAR